MKYEKLIRESLIETGHTEFTANLLIKDFLSEKIKCKFCNKKLKIFLYCKDCIEFGEEFIKKNKW